MGRLESEENPPTHGIESKTLNEKSHNGIVWKILPLNEV